MMDGFKEFMVLVNSEGQHSLWPAELDIPLGWDQIGPIGAKDDCLAYIEENWTDITPISARTGRLT